jgi:hypothetical protein
MDYSFDFKPSSESSEIIARLDDGKLIYLNNTDKNEIKQDKAELFYDFISYNFNRLSQKQADKLLHNYILQEIEPEDRQQREIYNDFYKTIKTSREIKFPDNQLEIIPYQGNENNVNRDVIFIGACSGAGKTTLISNYAKYFNKLYPKSRIYLLSTKPLEDEPAYDKIKKINEIRMDDETLDKIIEDGSYKYFVDKSGQSLVIFDDFDTLPKKLQEKVYLVLNSILQVGRSKRIFCIVSKHMLNTGQPTKVIWSEANKIVIFPNGLSRYALSYALRQYIGLDTKLINKMLASKSRWICIHSHMPRYYITQESISFI